MKANDVIKKVTKEHGEGIIGKGVSLHDSARIPTGAFPFDLASGGGFPRGRISVVYGPESSMKTTLALFAIAQFQRLEPNLSAAFVDAENSLEGVWAKKLGVNTDELLYAVPEYAEQAIDMTVDLLHAPDVGLIVLDSIAALTASAEIEKSAEDAVVGKGGLNASRFYKKATSALAHNRRKGHFPTLVCINQIRYKIGVMHGDPETQPGGMAFKFASALTVRLYGKDLMDAKVHAALPYAKHVKGVIKKYKVPITSKGFEFVVPNLTLPDHGIEVGRVESFKTVKAMLEKHGGLYKSENKKEYVVCDDPGCTFGTIKAFRMELRTNETFRDYVENWIIEREKPSELPETEDEADGNEG